MQGLDKGYLCIACEIIIARDIGLVADGAIIKGRCGISYCGRSFSIVYRNPNRIHVEKGMWPFSPSDKTSLPTTSATEGAPNSVFTCNMSGIKVTFHPEETPNFPLHGRGKLVMMDADVWANIAIKEKQDLGSKLQAELEKHHSILFHVTRKRLCEWPETNRFVPTAKTSYDHLTSILHDKDRRLHQLNRQDYHEADTGRTDSFRIDIEPYWDAIASCHGSKFIFQIPARSAYERSGIEWTRYGYSSRVVLKAILPKEFSDLISDSDGKRLASLSFIDQYDSAEEEGLAESFPTLSTQSYGKLQVE